MGGEGVKGNGDGEKMGIGRKERKGRGWEGMVGRRREGG